MNPGTSRIRWTVPQCLRRVALAIVLAVAVESAAPRSALSAAPAVAPSSRRVLLIVDRADDPFAERIRAEIAGLGLPVVTLEPWRTHETLGPLETVARGQHAVAAIRMVASRKGVEVWMADETSGRSLLRQLIVDESPQGPNQSLIALQTAELLRTSLLGQPGTPRPPAAPAATAAPEGSPALVAGPVPGSTVEAEVDAGLGVLSSPGAGAAALQAWLSLHRSIGPRWALALDLGAPLRGATVSGPEGSARLGAYLAGLTLLTRLTRAGSGFAATAGGGLAFVDLRAQGETSSTPALHTTAASAATGAVFARADGAFEVTRWLKVGARAIVGAATSRVTLEFAGNDAGAWGRPFLAGLLLADLCWR